MFTPIGSSTRALCESRCRGMQGLDKPMDTGEGWANTAVEHAVVHLEDHVETFARLAGL